MTHLNDLPVSFSQLETHIVTINLVLDAAMEEHNRPYSYIPGIGLELACNGGSFGEGVGGILFAFEKTVSLSCTLVPVLCQGYK